MTYRVLNAQSGEIMGSFEGAGTQFFELAMQLADQLAADKDHKVQFVVVQTVTVYETPTDAEV